MIVNKHGVLLEVQKGADLALATKVAQFLANSVNGTVFVSCVGGNDVAIMPGMGNEAVIIGAAMRGERPPGDDEPAAIEPMPVEDGKPKQTGRGKK